jgi:uncharacterized protein with FMN-binding domain
MPKRAFFAVLVGGTAIVLVLSFKTPTMGPVGSPDAAIVGGQSGSNVSGGGAVSGSFTGTTIQTPFGPVQVKVSVENGKITAVDALQAPSGDPHSSRLSDMAIPRLIQSTLTAQSARVNAVSGATYTSMAFMQSLQSALAQAGM